MSQAQPQYAPLLAYVPKARQQAAFYNCSNAPKPGPCQGTHFPGHIAPFGFDATLAGEPWASMSDHSNGVFACLNMIQDWEYGRNASFLRQVAFPFCRDALKFYQGWMTRRADGSWVNENDQANECNPSGSITVHKIYLECWQNNTVFSNGFARRVASALPSMAEHLGEAVDPQWEEIALKLDPLPTVLTNGTTACPFDPPRSVIVLAGNYTGMKPHSACQGSRCCGVECGTRACNTGCTAQVANDGMMDVMAWPVFPGEAVSLASPESLQQTVRDTLQLSAEWSQGNSFCSIFSQAARVRMPTELWLPEMRAVIDKSALTNMIVFQNGGGMEVAGALQVIADLMLQSVTVPGTSGETYMALFPLNVDASFSDLRFTRLRGKGAFVVSAAWSAATGRLDGPVQIESEVGGRCSLELPPSHAAGESLRVTDAAGKAVPAARAHGRWGFETAAGGAYSVVAQANGGA